MADVDDDVDEAKDDWPEEVDADDDDDERAGADTWVKPGEITPGPSECIQVDA